jgi:hypothetical protein
LKHFKNSWKVNINYCEEMLKTVEMLMFEGSDCNEDVDIGVQP